MADITVTASKVALLNPEKCDIRTYFAAEAITAGQVVYMLAAGTVGVADADAAGKQQARGIALQTVAANSPVDVLHEGEVAGFDVSGNANTLLYLSDTAGALGTTAGTMEVHVARVVCLTDRPTNTKVIRVFTNWMSDWTAS